MTSDRTKSIYEWTTLPKKLNIFLMRLSVEYLNFASSADKVGMKRKIVKDTCFVVERSRGTWKLSGIFGSKWTIVASFTGFGDHRASIAVVTLNNKKWTYSKWGMIEGNAKMVKKFRLKVKFREAKTPQEMSCHGRESEYGSFASTKPSLAFQIFIDIFSKINISITAMSPQRCIEGGCDPQTYSKQIRRKTIEVVEVIRWAFSVTFSARIAHFSSRPVGICASWTRLGQTSWTLETRFTRATGTLYQKRIY